MAETRTDTHSLISRVRDPGTDPDADRGALGGPVSSAISLLTSPPSVRRTVGVRYAKGDAFFANAVVESSDQPGFSVCVFTAFEPSCLSNLMSVGVIPGPTSSLVIRDGPENDWRFSLRDDFLCSVDQNEPDFTPVPHGVNTGDWSLDPAYFAYLQRCFGVFDVDAMASLENAKCKVFYSIQDSFFNHSVAGKRAYINAPFKLSGDAIRHMWTAHEEDPIRTESTHVFSLIYAKPTWWNLLKGCLLVGVIPKGANLFKAPSIPGSAVTIDRGPTPFVVAVVYRPPKVFRPTAIDRRSTVTLTGDWSVDVRHISKVLGFSLDDLILKPPASSRRLYGTQDLLYPLDAAYEDTLRGRRDAIHAGNSDVGAEVVTQSVLDCRIAASAISASIAGVQPVTYSIAIDPPVSQLFQIAVKASFSGDGSSCLVRALLDGGASLDLINTATALSICPNRADWQVLSRPISARGALEGKEEPLRHFLSIWVSIGDKGGGIFRVQRSFYIVPSTMPMILGKPFLALMERDYAVIEWRSNMLAFVFNVSPPDISPRTFEICYASQDGPSKGTSRNLTKTIHRCFEGYLGDAHWSLSKNQFDLLESGWMAAGKVARRDLDLTARPTDGFSSPVLPSLAGGFSDVVRTASSDPSLDGLTCSLSNRHSYAQPSLEILSRVIASVIIRLYTLPNDGSASCVVLMPSGPWHGLSGLLSKTGTLLPSGPGRQRFAMESAGGDFSMPWETSAFSFVPPSTPEMPRELRALLRPLVQPNRELSEMLRKVPDVSRVPRVLAAIKVDDEHEVSDSISAASVTRSGTPRRHRTAEEDADAVLDDLLDDFGDAEQIPRAPLPVFHFSGVARRLRFRTGTAASLFATYLQRPTAGKRSSPQEREAARRSSRSGLPRKHAFSDRVARANTPWRNRVARVWAQGHDPPRQSPRWQSTSWSALSAEARANPEDACVAFVRFGREVDDSPVVKVSVAALGDISAEERAYLEDILPRRDEAEADPHDSSVRAELTPAQQLRLDAIREKHSALFNKQTHFDDSAGRAPEFEMPIRLVDETTVTPRRGPRKLTPMDFEELKKQIGILLRAGMIEFSDSAFGAPILFVAKKGGARRFAVDFRQLNDLTVKQVTPLPRVDDMLQNLHGAKFFSKLDATWMFWQLRLKAEDRHKTGMVTPLGHFHWKVVPFGLTNAPGHCMNVMGRVLHPFLYHFCQVLLDDVIIYSKTMDEHLEHIALVLDALAEARIFLNPTKCEFCLSRMHYLGHVVSENAISPEVEKIQAMRDFPEPVSATGVRSFLGLTGYYRKLIRNYSEVAAPLTELTKGSISRPVSLDATQRAAFLLLKEKMVTAPAMALIDPSKPFVLQCDASAFALGAVLMQPDDDGELHPVGYFSKKLSDAQQKYTVTARELLAIVESFKHWRYDLLGAPGGQLVVHCDHRPLSFMRSVEPLSDMHARWQGVIEEMPFTIVHRPGTSMGPADALSRRDDHADNETRGASMRGKSVPLPDDLDSIPSSLQVGSRCEYFDLPRSPMPRALEIDLVWGGEEEYLGHLHVLATTSLAYLFPVVTRGGSRSPPVVAAPPPPPVPRPVRSSLPSVPPPASPDLFPRSIAQKRRSTRSSNTTRLSCVAFASSPPRILPSRIGPASWTRCSS